MPTSGLEEVRDRHELCLEAGLCWDQRQNRIGGSGWGSRGSWGLWRFSFTLPPVSELP